MAAKRVTQVYIHHVWSQICRITLSLAPLFWNTTCYWIASSSSSSSFISLLYGMRFTAYHFQTTDIFYIKSNNFSRRNALPLQIPQLQIRFVFIFLHLFYSHFLYTKFHTSLPHYSRHLPLDRVKYGPRTRTVPSVSHALVFFFSLFTLDQSCTRNTFSFGAMLLE